MTICNSYNIKTIITNINQLVIEDVVDVDTVPLLILLEYPNRNASKVCQRYLSFAFSLQFLLQFRRKHRLNPYFT